MQHALPMNALVVSALVVSALVVSARAFWLNRRKARESTQNSHVVSIVHVDETYLSDIGTVGLQHVVKSA